MPLGVLRPCGVLQLGCFVGVGCYLAGNLPPNLSSLEFWS